MNYLFQRNYKAVIDRGLINENTTDADFIEKAQEELSEVIEATFTELESRNEAHTNEEWADLLTVAANALIFRGVDLHTILTKIAIKNEKRAKV